MPQLEEWKIIPPKPNLTKVILWPNDTELPSLDLFNEVFETRLVHQEYFLEKCVCSLSSIVTKKLTSTHYGQGIN